MPEEKIGQVSRRRYDEIVAGDRELVAQIGRAMFTIGDHALEIEPVRPVGGSAPHSETVFGVNASLQTYADDIGLSLKTVLYYRFTSHRWPADRRRADVSHKVHSILANIPDDDERFAAIDETPVDDVTGLRRWTTNLAKKRAGHKPDRPGTVQEKVERIHDLAVDEEVAVEVTRDVLRRPQVAARLMEDTDVRRAVTDAQKPEHRVDPIGPLACCGGDSGQPGRAGVAVRLRQNRPQNDAPPKLLVRKRRNLRRACSAPFSGLRAPGSGRGAVPGRRRRSRIRARRAVMAIFENPHPVLTGWTDLLS